jgi:hypothetical protein
MLLRAASTGGNWIVPDTSSRGVSGTSRIVSLYDAEAVEEETALQGFAVQLQVANKSKQRNAAEHRTRHRSSPKAEVLFMVLGICPNRQ